MNFSTLLHPPSNVKSAIVALMTATNKYMLKKNQINYSFSMQSNIATFNFLLLILVFSSLQQRRLRIFKSIYNTLEI